MGKPIQQASRLVPMPTKLRPLLELANSIPPDWEFPNVYDLVWRSLQERGRHPSNEKLVALFEPFPMQTCPVFRRHVGRVVDSRITELMLRSDDCRSSRACLRAIASAAESRQKNVSTVLPVWEFLLSPIPSWVTTADKWLIDETGHVRIQTGTLAQALVGVEASRIRICPYCGILYWAGRSDQPACSRKHAHALRARAWRKRYEGKYKHQRYQRSESKNTKPKQ